MVEIYGYLYAHRPPINYCACSIRAVFRCRFALLRCRAASFRFFILLRLLQGRLILPLPRSRPVIYPLMNEQETAANVIDLALKSYAREGRLRLPVLGSAINKFLIYCPIAGPEAFRPEETIGRYGVRNFMLGKKPETLLGIGNDEASSVPETERKGSGSFKAWLNKSLNLKISSH